MVKKISAFLLIAALVLTFSACSVFSRLQSFSEELLPAETDNAFLGSGIISGIPDATHIFIQGEINSNGNGITIIVPELTEPEEPSAPLVEDLPESPFFLNETWYYFHQYDNEHGRLGQIQFADDGTFTLTSFYYIREPVYSIGWYCPGTETSGVDTPQWVGSYLWNGSSLQLLVEDYVRITWEQPDEWSPPEPVHKELVPVDQLISMTATADYGSYYTMDTDPLPLTSDFTCTTTGSRYIFRNISDLDTLFP